jgi:NADPH:quinone reductase-like Zn-dependent oxidoreductase
MKALFYERWGADACQVGEIPLPLPAKMPKERKTKGKGKTKGGKKKGELVFEAPPPAGKCLVRVHAASLNPVDWKLRSGNRKLLLPGEFSFPRVMGFDFCGEIAAVGPVLGSEETSESASGSDSDSGVREGDVSIALSVSVGDHVMGFARGVHSGACAEYMLVDVDCVVPKPDNASCQACAAVGLAGVTCVFAFEEAGIPPRLKGSQEDGSDSDSDEGGVDTGPRVLVLGGSGGVGTLAIQLAKHVYGASFVAATASTGGEKEELCRSLGADEVVDYRTQKFEKALKGYDFDFALVCSDDDPGRCRDVMKPSGTVVGLNIPAPVEALRAWLQRANPRGTQIGVRGFLESSVGGSLTNLFGGAYRTRSRLAPARYEGVIGTGDCDALLLLAASLRDGLIDPAIDSEFDLEDALEALARLESGRAMGKVVVNVASPKK